MSSIFGNEFLMTNKALDFVWKQQQLTANNIANVDTPNYKAQHISFEDEFKNRLNHAMKSGNSSTMEQAITQTKAKVVASNNSKRVDGNGVDMDVENVELVKTTLQYQYLVQAFNSDYNRLRTVIRGN
ncbi:MAG TPA: flagellar basal body rod protein FlgB [Candidatus Scybalomonas excrementigallinarum]|nr:flagellar basal body rod protein FlgB [Candidatus Scybalomonas excrementigallinarum]